MQHHHKIDIQLPLGQFRACFTARDRVELGAFAGSTWRGAFGHALKRALCVTNAPLCTECALWRSCGYAYVFETPPPENAEKLRKYPAAPHPFVLHIDLESPPVTPGTAYEVGFTLIGRGNQHLQGVAFALAQTGAGGIGPGQAKLELDRVEQGSNARTTIYRPGQSLQAHPVTTPAIPDSPDRIRVILESPLRLTYQNQLVRVPRFSFGALFSSLLRRISLLSYFHTDTPLETDFAGLTQAAREVPLLRPNLRWYGWQRYSTRQKRKVKVGGLLGQFELSGADIAPFWPFLYLGQYVHSGALTSMGLGRYRIEAVPASAPTSNRPDTPRP